MGIVLHDTSGNGGHGDTLYLAKAPEANRPVSVDFTVERDGGIWALNPDLDKYACAHAGRATAFQGLKNGDVTRATIGIEITQTAALPKAPATGLSPEDRAAFPYTSAQVQAVARLCAYLASRYKLTSDRITTHRNIIQDASRSDPRQFPFSGEYGFWHYYWAAKGKEAQYLASLTEKV